MKKMIYIIGAIIIILICFFVYKNFNGEQSNSFDLNKLKDSVLKYAFDKEILSDMTAISLPVPHPKNNGNYPVEFMLYYSIPSNSGGRMNPDISLPYATINIDAKTQEIINFEKKEINDLRQPENMPATMKTPDQVVPNDSSLFELREKHQKITPLVFSLYWNNKILSADEINIVKEYAKINESLMSITLKEEYHKINPDFFEWLNKNTVKNN